MILIFLICVILFAWLILGSKKAPPPHPATRNRVATANNDAVNNSNNNGGATEDRPGVSYSGINMQLKSASPEEVTEGGVLIQKLLKRNVSRNNQLLISIPFKDFRTYSKKVTAVETLHLLGCYTHVFLILDCSLDKLGDLERHAEADVKKQLDEIYEDTITTANGGEYTPHKTNRCFSIPKHRVLLSSSFTGRVAITRQFYENYSPNVIVMDYDVKMKEELARFGYNSVHSDFALS